MKLHLYELRSVSDGGGSVVGTLSILSEDKNDIKFLGTATDCGDIRRILEDNKYDERYVVKFFPECEYIFASDKSEYDEKKFKEFIVGFTTVGDVIIKIENVFDYALVGYDKDNDLYQTLATDSSLEKLITMGKIIARTASYKHDYIYTSSHGEPFDWFVVCDRDEAVYPNIYYWTSYEGQNGLLQTLNEYAKLAKDGNKEVLPAIGRVVERLEKETGKKVVATESGYVLR